MASVFVYSLQKQWPPLAWLAECSEEQDDIHIKHGSSVEIHDDWFCEAVWDGLYSEGGFDETDIVFGSGGKVRSDRTVFVSSGSTVDRLQYFRRGEKTFVSNSLACLRSTGSGWPDADFRHYYESFFATITKGLDQYENTVPGDGPTLVYFNNLSWDGQSVSLCDKPFPRRDFGSFGSYVEFLKDSIRALAVNACDPSRRICYGLVGTASSGYDSPTVAALSINAGLKEVISFATDRNERDDDGKAIAEQLGLDVTVLHRQDWRSVKMAEIYFLAADSGGWDVFLAGAKDKIRRRILLTGYHGDKIWEKDPRVPLTPNIVRGDASGLSFTEYRLLTETIHVPAPFMGVRDIEHIVKISQGDEMSPWDIGGDYNRPICRRILEQAGVPRQSFGMHKKAASNIFSEGDVALSRSAQIDFNRWFSRNVDRPEGKSNWPAQLSRFLGRAFIPQALSFGDALARRFISIFPASIEQGISWRMDHLRSKILARINYFLPWAFPWAVEYLAAKYRVRERR